MKNYNSLPAISIVGRPNVGKSSLFNCLLKERRAVVVEQSGTTRDRVEAFIHLDKLGVKLVDTGGYHSRDKGHISLEVQQQIFSAMDEAAFMVMVVDAKSGLTPADEEIAALLRKFDKPVLLVANKTDNDKVKNNIVEFYELGFGEALAVSCLHRRGIRSLKNNLLKFIGDVKEEPEKKDLKYLKIAIVGRPNVGKSSFVNKMLTRNRVIVSDTPGTTRDSIDTHFSCDGDEYILIDTAGMRHRRKIRAAVDVYSIMRAKGSIERADVAILLIDAADGVTKDDLGILDFIEEKGTACLILVNKWDLAEGVDDLTREEYEKEIVAEYNRISKYPLSFISCKTGKDVLTSLPMVKLLDANLDHKASTPFLNKIFEKNNPSKVSIPRRKKRPNFLYILQSSTRPVEFRFFVNDPSSVLPAHMSYIENKLRENLPLSGIPIKIRIRKSRRVKLKKI
ncbi:MAG: ribosome biogenesis GTPase Der [Candidatus Omnitrophica bacterium]|nr:ribosome biogenesis GTPase Der [Candidatus Omnitrophota bacterium]